MASEQRIASTISSYGVHVVEGFHRTYMSNIVPTAKAAAM
jgi:hypothetical protein